MSSNNIGLHCKACDAPLSEVDDAELCYECMAVVYQYNRKLIETNTNTDYWEVDDIDLIQPQDMEVS